MVRQVVCFFLPLVVSLKIATLIFDSRMIVPGYSRGVAKTESDLALGQESTNGLQLCRLPVLHFNGIHLENNGTKLGILFQCVGKEYDEFGDKLFSFANNRSVHGNHWGRRSFPIPRDKSVLMFGNSHTRQTAHALVGQHHDKVQSASCLQKNNVCTFQFDNNVSLHVVANSPVVHSHKWLDLLAGVVGRPLQSFDAIVLGKFNRWVECSKKFQDVMTQDGRELDKSIDIKRITPPNMSTVAQVYSGPIVAVSMYAKSAEQQSNKTRAMVAELIREGRKNIVYIDGRKYIGELGECGSDLKTGDPGHCNEGSPGHRCTGPKGGHPDLIAWDVIESLYTLFS